MARIVGDGAGRPAPRNQPPALRGTVLFWLMGAVLGTGTLATRRVGPPAR